MCPLRSEQQERLNHFLEDVDEQIAYKPIHAAVNEELRAHVEDKAEVYMEYGIDEDEAYEKAIRDMGDASVIGIQMNELHHLRIAKPLLAAILILTALAAAGNRQQYGGFGGSQNTCILWGLLVLVLSMWYGYPLLLKHAGKLTVLFTALGGFYMLIHSEAGRRLFENVMISSPVTLFNPCRVFSPTVIFLIFQTAVPVMAVLLYHGRHRWLTALSAAGAFLVFLLWVNSSQFVLKTYTYTSILALLVSGLGIMLYMIGKGYANIDKRKGFLSIGIFFLSALLLWAFPQKKMISESLDLFFRPQEYAYNAWTDSYNDVLVQELLKRSKWVGEPKLSREELIGYRTSEWYYKNGPGEWSGAAQTLKEYAEYKMQYQEADFSILLDDVVPQSYGKNYWIFRWFMKYGRIPAGILLLVVFSMYGLLFATTFQIRNRLGRLAALGGSLALSVQGLLYILGNFGHRFGMFGNLPFVSEGFISITGSAVLAGLVLSAYRFDTVVTEKG